MVGFLQIPGFPIFTRSGEESAKLKLCRAFVSLGAMHLKLVGVVALLLLVLYTAIALGIPDIAGLPARTHNEIYTPLLMLYARVEGSTS